MNYLIKWRNPAEERNVLVENQSKNKNMNQQLESKLNKKIKTRELTSKIFSLRLGLALGILMFFTFGFNIGQAEAAITYVGGRGAGRANANSTTNIAINSGLTGGSGTAAQAGDLVIVSISVGSQNASPTVNVSGYTPLTVLRPNTATYDTNFSISYKFMPATPDTTVTIPATIDATQGQAYTIQVFRGVDPTTPLDGVTETYATGNSVGNQPNPASITPLTSGAWIYFGGGGAAAVGTTLFTASYLTNFLTYNGADTTDGTVGSGYYTAWSSGAYDGAAFGGGSTNSANSWGALTLVLRPAPVIVKPTVTTQAASAVGQTSATLNGTITDIGNANPTVQGFAWGTSSSLSGGDTSTSTQNGTFGVGPFFVSYGSGSFACNTTYYSRAYATNSAGTGYGSIQSFLTSPCKPTVTTSAAASITQITATLNGNVTVQGGANATEHGFAWGTDSALATAATTTGGAFTGTGAFTSATARNISGLSCNTIYYYRAYATNSGGTGFSSVANFTSSPCKPSVGAGAVSIFTQTTATLEGYISATGGANATEHGFAWGTDSALATAATTTGGGFTGTGTFTSSSARNISGLSCNTVYYYRAYATNTGDTGYSSITNFTSSPCNPTVSTSAASSVTQTTATLNGNVDATGGGNATEHGFAWGTDSALATAATTTGGGFTGTGAFTSASTRNISGLSCNTVYYLRAYATNSGGTGYGAIINFTTSPCKPVMGSSDVSAITQTTATLNGSVDDNGGADATEHGFAWGTDSALATAATTTGGGFTGTGAFTSSSARNISGLSCNTVYYYRAYATNSGGTGYSIIVNFTSSPCKPTVIISAVGSITQTSASLYGNITATGGADATEHGFAWGTNISLATAATTTGGAYTGTGVFTAPSATDISGLSCNTNYYIRAYATNSGGTDYSSVSSFATQPCKPTVSTQSASSVTSTRATFNGNITNTGGANPTIRGFAWGTSATMEGDTATTSEIGSFSTGAFTDNSRTLVCNTTYYTRAYAYNSVGTSTGAISASFTTGACNYSPTTALNSPVNASSDPDTTPTLNFTGTDANSDAVEYNVQIDTLNTFNSGSTTNAWNALNATGAPKSWLGVSVNSSNGDVYAVVFGGDIYKQTAGTGTWNALNATGAPKQWWGIAVNPSNGDVYAVVFGGDIYKQTAGTGTWNALNATGATKTWNGVSVNSSNGDVYAVVSNGDIYKQTAGTGTWNALNATGATKSWHGVSVNSSNGDVYAVVSNGDIYKQTAGTGTWNALNATGGAKLWYDISVNSSNGDVYAVVYNGDIYKQTAGTGTWNALNATGGAKWWYGISVNSSNGDVYASVDEGDIYKQTIVPLSKYSIASDAGFTAGHPFTSGQAKEYTVQAGDALALGTYYWRTRAIDPSGSNAYGAWSSTRSFIVIAKPTVLTNDIVDSITKTTATLNGSIVTTGGANATQHGFAWGTDSALATAATTTGGGFTGTGAFTSSSARDLSGLSCNTTYYFRAYATNPGGTGLGSIQFFSTLPCAPTVTTQSASSVLETSATLNGNITATGGSNATVRGFAWGTNSSLSGGDTATTTDNGTWEVGAFTANLATLTCGTTYYSRAYATNPTGTGYGAISASFTTTSCSTPVDIAQLHYRWRSDNGSETNATFLSAEDTSLVNNIFPGDRLRLRVLLSNAGGPASNYLYRLEHASSSCSSWISVPSYASQTTEKWIIDTSTYVSNGQPTTNNAGLTDPAGAFVPGRIQTQNNQTQAMTLGTNQFTELEYSIKSTSAIDTDVNNCFRLTNNGSNSFFTYSAQPIVVVSSVARKNTSGGGGGGGSSGASSAGGETQGSAPAQTGGTATTTPPDEGSGSGTPQGGGGQGGGGGDLGYNTNSNTINLASVSSSGIVNIIIDFFNSFFGLLFR